MMNKFKYAISLLVFTAFIFLQLGCSTFRAKGFDRVEMEKQLNEKPLPQYDDKEIKASYQKKSNLKKPFRLAVYFKTPQNVSANTWRWTEADKAFLDEMGKELKNKKIVSEFFPILNTLVANDDLKSIRLTASKHQADAVLIVNGTGQVDRYMNKSGAFYALIVPLLFVEGSQADTLFVTNATMWDVRNEYLYLTAESEGLTSTPYAAAFAKTDKDLYSEAKTQSLNKLKEQIKKAAQEAQLL